VKAANAPVILISIDTLRSDHLPMYGYSGVKTPALDALRGDSILFQNAWSHCPMTLPSHVSMLTGLLPTQHDVRNNDVCIGPEFPTDVRPVPNTGIVDVPYTIDRPGVGQAHDKAGCGTSRYPDEFRAMRNPLNLRNRPLDTHYVATYVEIPFAKRTKSALETAAREADALQHGHIGTEHLLLALAVTPGTDRVLEAQGIGADALRRLIAQRPPPPGGPLPPITPADARAVTAEARRYATLGQLAAAVVIVRSIAEQHANVPGVQELAYRACHELEALKAIIAEA